MTTHYAAHTLPNPLTVGDELRDELNVSLVQAAKEDEQLLAYLLKLNNLLIFDLANRAYIRNYELDDLVHLAQAEFCQAVLAFDASKGAKLSTTATHYIQKKFLQVSTVEGAQKRGGSRGRAHEDHCQSFEALYEKEGDQGLPDSFALASSFQSPEHACFTSELRRLVQSYVGRCQKERDQRILTGFLFEDLNQRELAEAFGLNQSTVSRIIQKHLGHLRLILCRHGF